MGWSIKKPLGGKKSVFNQVITPVKAAVTVVPLAAVNAVAPKAAASINEKMNLVGKDELKTATVGVKIAAAVGGTALVAGAVAASTGGAAAVEAMKKAEDLKKAAEAEAKKIKESDAAKALDKAKEIAAAQVQPVKTEAAVANALFKAPEDGHATLGGPTPAAAGNSAPAQGAGKVPAADPIAAFFSWILSLFGA